jgi:hypothetical protein
LYHDLPLHHIEAGWNLLDLVVVLVSTASLGPNSLLNNMTVIRMLRALRVVRLFGRVESLKKVLPWHGLLPSTSILHHRNPNHFSLLPRNVTVSSI